MILRFSALALRRAQGRGGRIVAIGTTVVRALEHAAGFDGSVRAGGTAVEAGVRAGVPPQSAPVFVEPSCHVAESTELRCHR